MADSRSTKRLLARSLKELMETAPLSRISVRTITENCGMNRQTFYYHFNDKYELINWIYTEETAAYLEKFTDPITWTDGLGDLLAYMQNSRAFYISALDSAGRDSFMEYMTRQIRELLVRMIKTEGLRRELEQEDLDFIGDFYAYAFMGLIIRWIRQGAQGSAAGYACRVRRMVRLSLPLHRKALAVLRGGNGGPSS